jgi:hypothetical protein
MERKNSNQEVLNESNDKYFMVLLGLGRNPDK